MEVSVIIPTLNRSKVLDENLKHLSRFKEIKQVIIVDDASSDETKKVIGRWKKQLPIVSVKNSKTRGSAYSWNVAIKKAREKYSLLLNDDTYIEDKHFFEIMGEDVGRAEIIGPRLKNTLYEKGGFGPRIKKLLLHYLFGDPLPPQNKSSYVNFVSGIMFLPTRILKELRFDEDYKGNCNREESDFQVRAKKKGYRIYHEAKTWVLHNQTGEGGQRRFSEREDKQWRYINHLRFLEKNYPWRKIFWIPLYKLFYKTLVLRN